MTEMIGSRKIAEHLCTFARLLEVEAVRASTLGIKMDKDLGREAREVRGIANQLWEANIPISLDAEGRSSRAGLCWQFAGEPALEAANQPAAWSSGL